MYTHVIFCLVWVRAPNFVPEYPFLDSHFSYTQYFQCIFSSNDSLHICSTISKIENGIYYLKLKVNETTTKRKNKKERDETNWYFVFQCRREQIICKQTNSTFVFKSNCIKWNNGFASLGLWWIWSPFFSLYCRNLSSKLKKKNKQLTSWSIPNFLDYYHFFLFYLFLFIVQVIIFDKGILFHFN